MENGDCQWVLGMDKCGKWYRWKVYTIDELYFLCKDSTFKR